MGNREYTILKNRNRGYMRLHVWQNAVELLRIIHGIVPSNKKLDYKLRSQLINSTQSISANIAEGYSRRSINEYLQFLYIALGSLSETLTRLVGLKETAQISEAQFQQIDTHHFEVENKLLALIKSLEKKRDEGSWIDHLSDAVEIEYGSLEDQ